MRARLWIPVVVLLAAVGVVVTADDPPPRSPQSAEAMQAKTKYEEALGKAQLEFEEATRTARKKFIEDLDRCLKAALKGEQLDEAIRVRDWKAAVERNREGPAGKGRHPEGSVAFRGVQYRVFLADVRWTEARAACRKRGGDLAVIDSKEKREFLASQAGSVQLWVGAMHDSKGVRWQWANGAPVAADAWSPGRPQNNGPYAVMFGKTGLTGDAKDEVPDCKGYICEWKP